MNIQGLDRKSTRLNSSHLGISYAVFCLKKKSDVEAIERARPSPHAGKIRLAVRRPGRGRREIWFSVGQTWRSRRGIVQPLRAATRRQKANQDECRNWGK